MIKKKIKYIVGIDEVGRGALAGPVAVTALALSQKLKISARGVLPRRIRLGWRSSFGGKNKSVNRLMKIPLRDSKKLSPKQREIWFDFIKKQKIPYAIASVSPKMIDKINISNAANLAASRAVCKLISFKFRSSKLNYDIFLDGGLYLNRKKLKNLKFKNLKTIIKGDEKIPAISLASIAAKVSRDKYMKKLHKKYPRYDFVNNVGYGTKKHIRAIKKYGLSSVHRRTFCDKLTYWKNKQKII